MSRASAKGASIELADLVDQAHTREATDVSGELQKLQKMPAAKRAREVRALRDPALLRALYVANSRAASVRKEVLLNPHCDPQWLSEFARSPSASQRPFELWTVAQNPQLPIPLALAMCQRVADRVKSSSMKTSKGAVARITLGALVASVICVRWNQLRSDEFIQALRFGELCPRHTAKCLGERAMIRGLSSQQREPTAPRSTAREGPWPRVSWGGGGCSSLRSRSFVGLVF